MSLIYLDYAATTPVAPQVAEKMAAYLTREGCFANPASRAHRAGWEAEEAVERARSQVARLIGAGVREIIWTSGATEANNLALIGAARAHQGAGRHLITSKIEHKAVLDPCRWLEKNGWTVTYLQPDAQGRIQPEALARALRPETFLVSLMWVNNEVGSVQPIAALGECLADHPCFFHVDAAQAVGKLPVDVTSARVDLLSLSAHKFYGPKGIGALYVRRQPRVPLEPLMHGGGHEQGLRSGTLPTHQLVGLGEADQLAQERLSEDADHLRACRDLFLQQLDPADYRQTAAHPDQWPGILNLTFAGIEAETLLSALPHLAVSTGSACNSRTLDPSYVLTALGLSPAQALSSLRFSFGRDLPLAAVKTAAQQVHQAVQRLRA